MYISTLSDTQVTTFLIITVCFCIRPFRLFASGKMTDDLLSLHTEHVISLT